MLTCISHFMQFLYSLSVYLTSSLLSKCDVVVIPNSILGPKEKENWRVLRLSSHLYRYFVFYQRWYMEHVSAFYSLVLGMFQMAVLVLFLANSLVNPIIYALRMPGFREGLLQLVYRVPDLPRIALANLPLRNLWRA